MITLQIKPDLALEVMNLLGARAKYYEKLIESTELGPESKADVEEWQKMSEELWALVRQFSQKAA